MKKIDSIEKNTIGNISSLLNISAESIRKYQKRGIINLDIDESNGYRYFNLSSINKLLRFTFYKKCGFSGETANNLLNTESLEDIYDSVSDQIVNLEKEITLAKLKIERLEELREALDNIDTYKNKVVECDMSSFYYVKYYKDGEVVMENKKAINNMVNLMPFATPSPVFRIEEIDNLEYGLIIDEKYMFDDKYKVGLEKFEGSKALYTIVENTNMAYFNKNNLDYLIDYAKSHNYHIELIIGKTILSMNNLILKPSRYHEVWAIIK